MSATLLGSIASQANSETRSNAFHQRVNIHRATLGPHANWPEGRARRY
jgi:hypothetical protein